MKTGSGTGESEANPWVVFAAAGAAGFIAQGTFANTVVAMAILLLSLFIATFLAVLAHGILADRSTPDREDLAPPETAAEQSRV